MIIPEGGAGLRDKPSLPPRQALDLRYQVHDQTLTKSIRLLIKYVKNKYMPKKSRSVILPELKNNVKRRGGAAGQLGYREGWASQIYPPRLGAGKLKSPPPSKSRGVVGAGFKNLA